MAMIHEAGFTITGTVRTVTVDTYNGADYASYLVENATGISEIRMNSDATAAHRNVKQGATVSWLVSPWVASGVSKKTGRPYAFLHMNYVQDAPQPVKAM